MALDTQMDRCIRRISHVLKFLEPIAEGCPDDFRPVLPTTFHGIQDALSDVLRVGELDAPQSPVLAEVMKPLMTLYDEFATLTTVPTNGSELRKLLSRILGVARATHHLLVSDERLHIQSVDQVLEEFSEEYRMSLILNLTANHALSQRVKLWQNPLEGDGVGAHLDLLSLEFTDKQSSSTIPMASLIAASTGAPVVMTPHNFGSAIHEMATGGAPPPIYRMAYAQWFTTIIASWEDVYRPRLAVAYSNPETGEIWEKNDIRSKFFYEIQKIRNDFAHHQGICHESSDNTLFDWLEPGKPIAPTPRNMLDLLNLFPADELRQPPKRLEGAKKKVDRLPYSFDVQWIEKLKNHVIKVSPSRARRAGAIKKVLDDWMDTEPPADN